MAFASVRYFSQSLQKQSTVNVLFPDGPEIPRPWGTFYLLHGLSDDCNDWLHRSTIAREVEGLPLLVAMPDGGRGWYSNAEGGPAYEDDLVKDVRGLVERTFPVGTDRASRAIGGLSMGGLGAVLNAFRHPDLFSSATSHSGVLNPVGDPGLAERFGAEFTRIFQGANPPNPLCLAARVAHSQRPALRIDCGVDDFLIEHGRRFHQELNALGYPHEYVENAGGHDWDYWTRHVREAVAFHARNLNLPRTS